MIFGLWIFDAKHNLFEWNYIYSILVPDIFNHRCTRPDRILFNWRTLLQLFPFADWYSCVYLAFYGPWRSIEVNFESLWYTKTWNYWDVSDSRLTERLFCKFSSCHLVMSSDLSLRNCKCPGDSNRVSRSIVIIQSSWWIIKIEHSFFIVLHWYIVSVLLWSCILDVRWSSPWWCRARWITLFIAGSNLKSVTRTFF